MYFDLDYFFIIFFCSIYGLALDTATERKGAAENTEEVLKSSQALNSLMRAVEVCECPEHYTGNSCEVSKI